MLWQNTTGQPGCSWVGRPVGEGSTDKGYHVSEGKATPTMGAQDSPEAIYDARKLGKPKMAVFGLQHMFAMFGATILVPTLTGLSVSATLLFAGLGTLLFHFVSKGKVPAFLGSSFAFIAGYAAIAPNGEADLLPYACLGVACAGLLYLVLSALFKVFGATRVMRFFPPVVTGPIVISIGLILASSAITNASTNWPIALVAIAIIVIANIWGKGMVKIIPSCWAWWGRTSWSAAAGVVDFTGVAEAAWIGMPFTWNDTVFSIFGAQFDAGLAITAIITIMPLAFATMIEHIGDVSAISSTCNRNYIAEPGLHRTLLGDGLATILASLFGAPANTTYGENTGVLALTPGCSTRASSAWRRCSPSRSRSARSSLPSSRPCRPASSAACRARAVRHDLGGGHPQPRGEPRRLQEEPRNVLITALILVLSLGIAYSAAGAIVVPVGARSPSRCRAWPVGSIVGHRVEHDPPRPRGRCRRERRGRRGDGRPAAVGR